MADRTSAALFGKIFTLLSNNPTKENKELAKDIYYDLISDYDFNTYQMNADDALIILGLAHRSLDPEYPNEVIYD